MEKLLIKDINVNAVEFSDKDYISLIDIAKSKNPENPNFKPTDFGGV